METHYSDEFKRLADNQKVLKFNLTKIYEYILDAKPEEVRQIVKFAEPYCNVETIKQAEDRTGLTYEGVRKYRKTWKVFNKNLSVKDEVL